MNRYELNNMEKFKPYELPPATRARVMREVADAVRLGGYLAEIATCYDRKKLLRLWHNAKCKKIRYEALATYVRLNVGDKKYRNKDFSKFKPAKHGINPKKFNTWKIEFLKEDV